jgi:hypothetical protein
LTDAEWLDSLAGLHRHDSQNIFSLPEPHFHRQDALSFKHPTSQAQSQVTVDQWSLQPLLTYDPQLDLQPSQEPNSTYNLFDARCAPRFSVTSSEPCTFPLTPPSSTPGESATPGGGAGESHKDVAKNGFQDGFDASTTYFNEPTISDGDLTVPNMPTDMMWPNEDFVKFLDSELFLPNLDSFDHGPNDHQSTLNSGWDYQNTIASHGAYQPYQDNHHGQGINPVPNQPSHSSLYPSIPSNAFNQTTAFSVPTPNMASYNSTLGVQFSQPDTFTTTDTLFDSFSLACNSLNTGRRNGAKADQRATAKDRELIEWKKQGLSYKEIKARGGFDEAESTLRGRYRTLTKPKHLRVRKPEWQPKDVITVQHVSRA